MYTITVPLDSYGARGQRTPPLAHYDSHYHALLFPITAQPRGGGRRGLDDEGLLGNFGLEAYGDVAGCSVQCVLVCEEEKFSLKTAIYTFVQFGIVITGCFSLPTSVTLYIHKLQYTKHKIFTIYAYI